jgi:peptidoglycan/xylan/chitin deacetylase (PgdA/CDA1 family)
MSYAAALTRTAKRQAKRIIARSLILTRRVDKARNGRRENLCVLMYHGVLPEVRVPAAYGDLFVSARDFLKHLRHLKQHYQPMSLDEVAATIAANKPFPPRAVAVTFDDGYENTVEVAVPLLAEAGIPATVFVPSDLIGTGRYLWFDCLRLLVRHAWRTGVSFDLAPGIQVRAVVPLAQETHFLGLSARILDLPVVARSAVQAEIQRLIDRDGLSVQFPEFALTNWPALRATVEGGILSVGSHARAHGDLSGMSLQQQTEDLGASRQRIEQELGRPCVSIAYPYGRWNPDTIVAAREAGYRCALTVENGFNETTTDPFRLRRIMAGDKGHLSILSARVSGGWDKLRVRL